MKRVLFPLLITLMGFVLWTECVKAQSYASLWKATQVAINNDLPQTALEKVKAISRKADKEHCEGQYLKAIVSQMQLQESISPDSLSPLIRRLEQRGSLYTAGAEKALLHATLGKLYEQQTFGQNVKAEARLKAKAHYQKAMEQPDVLAQCKAIPYLPFVRKGKESKKVDNSLLWVIGKWSIEGLRRLEDRSKKEALESPQLLNKMLNIYQRSGKKEAYFLTLLDSISFYTTGKEQVKRYKEILPLYAMMPQGIELYIQLSQSYLLSTKERKAWALEGIKRYEKQKRVNVLRSELQSITSPYLRVDLPNDLSPLSTDSLTFMARNIKRITLSFYPLHLPANAEVLQTSLDEDFIKKHTSTNAVCEQSFDLPDVPDYEDLKKTFPFSTPEAGTYYIKIRTDGIESEARLYNISRLYVLRQGLPNNRIRIVVVEKETGNPVPMAKVYTYTTQNRKRVWNDTLQTNQKGEVETTLQNDGSFFVQTASDKWLNNSSLSVYSAFYEKSPAYVQRTNLYTDRIIYRPGQTVKYGGIAYALMGDSISTLVDTTMVVNLKDANGRKIGCDTLHTDKFGAFGGQFVLPVTCLAGSFSINTSNTFTSFRVEFYRRPTFRVTFDRSFDTCALGDTLTLRGKAETYSGVPLAFSRLSYTTNRSFAFFRQQGRPQTEVARGEAVTDSMGNFSLRIPLIAADDTGVHPLPATLPYCFTTEAVLTADDGETQTASHSLRVGNKRKYISTDWSKSICREHLKAITITCCNAAQQNIDEAGTFVVYKGTERIASGKFRSNTAFVPQILSTLPSASYRMEATVGNEADSLASISQSFTLFSLNDVRPLTEAPLHVFQTSNEFNKTQPVTVCVGVPLKNATLFYDLFAGNHRIESKTIHVNDTLLKFTYTYQEEYGDGVCAVFAVVRDNTTYSEQITIQKPQPDKRLTLNWRSFRNYLTPGQHEEWRLQVMKGNAPVEASVLATLYDASLNVFAPLEWNVFLPFHRAIPSSRWWSPWSYTTSFYLNSKLKEFVVSPIEWNGIDETLFHFSYLGQQPYRIMTKANVRIGSKRALSNTMDALTTSTVENIKESASESFRSTELTLPNSELRTNFNETAFFCPSLRTDKKGEVGIAFTLPQSMTSWCFKALAHTQNMDYASLDTTVIARKDFMVQLNLPRFMRAGDATTLVATLRNLTPKAIKGTTRLVITDAETGKEVATQRIPFHTEAKGLQVLSFPFHATTDYSLLVCTIEAMGHHFGDGEQRYLPVLSDCEEIVESQPFTVENIGEKQIDITPLIQKLDPKSKRNSLTIEYTEHPSWVALQALPLMIEPEENNAYSWATAYYATTLSDWIANSNPALRQWALSQASTSVSDSLSAIFLRNEDLKQLLVTETPWANQATAEVARSRNLVTLFDEEINKNHRYTYLARLQELQQANGAWSWYKGMNGSKTITLRLVEMLTRLQTLCPQQAASIAPLTHRAIAYLDSLVAIEVKALRKSKEPITLNEDLLTYLYVYALRPTSVSSDRDFLLQHLASQTPSYTMYGKAIAAIVLHHAGQTKSANRCVESMLQHTICTPEMGRYFDTNKAPYSTDSYRIPTQVAAIEALRTVRPKEVATQNEMTRWLLQNKRTQMWSNPLTSVDAVYSLLQSNEEAFTTSPAAPLSIVNQQGKKTILFTDKLSTQNYQRATFLGKGLSSVAQIEVQKQSNTLSWGAAYLTQVVPLEKVKATSSGLQVERHFTVLRHGEWEPITEGTLLNVGEKVRCNYTLHAERDFDFVCLRAPRSANVEPTRPLSGYTWNEGIGYYRAVGDASTQYFFDNFRKGTSLLVDEVRVDRAGSFAVGIASLQCVYAPEFRGHTTNQFLKSIIHKTNNK
ncbi:MAG: alpha-2-macroglobulin family protein [Bacteroidaceae bacterium]